MNSLQLGPALRREIVLGSGARQRHLRYYDFVIDGHSLCQQRAARLLIGCLGWPSGHEAAKSRLLGEAPGDFSDGRVSLLLCPECGDLACGAISLRVRREGKWIHWEEFGLQFDYEEDWERVDLGPFTFEFDPYRAAIRGAPLLDQRRRGNP